MPAACSASVAPYELPTRWAGAPAAPITAPTSATSAGNEFGPAGTSLGAYPRRQTSQSSYRSASRSATGCQECSPPPEPCSSTTGIPVPSRRTVSLVPSPDRAGVSTGS